MLRAVAMFFVVLLHASQGVDGWWIYCVFIGPIMIPLFFCISGYLFKTRGGNVKEFFIGLLKKLVIPWVFLSLIWLRVVLIPVNGWGYWFEKVYVFISGEVHWFMPALIISEIILFFIQKWSGSFRNTCLLMCGCVLLGFVLAKFDLANFAMINRALIAQGFLLLGMLFKRYEQWFSRIKPMYLILGCILYAALGIMSVVMLPGQYIDVHLNMYQNVLLCFAMIVLGNLLLLTIAGRISKIPAWITYVGQNTLFCYFYHGYGYSILLKIVGIVVGEVSNSWLLAIIKAVFGMTLCAIASLVLNKFVPRLVGRWK